MITAAQNPACTLILRPLVRETPLGLPAKPPAIIHPANDPAYHALAARLAQALLARGVGAECATDVALMPERSTPLPDSYRARPLIVLGSLGTNRVLQPHYANFLCATDAAYPGAGGWELRTLVDPYHTGANLILAGGSDAAGVTRAVDRLLEVIAAAPDSVALPWLLEVALNPGLAARFAQWPHTPLDSALLKLPGSHGYYYYADLIRTLSAYTQMWWLTADRRYADFALVNFRALNAHVASTYGDWHYMAEKFLRALPLLAGGGLLTDAEITRTYGLLLGTALASQNDWWRMREGRPPFGHRHQGKGTYEFLMLARCLRDTTDPSPELRALCDRWMAECQSFLDGLVRAGIDDQDDESTFNNLAQLFRYALGEERHELFTAGHARRSAERAVALHDNMGCGAGQGGYGEGLSMHYQQEAATQVACSAFYHGDGELKWIYEKLPRLARAQRFMPFQFTPIFVHQFETGNELAPEPLSGRGGVAVLPATSHQYALCTEPPVHVEPRGHMANALETWLTPEGVALTRLAPERAFDKLVLRGGFAPADPYLLIQGYQGGFRWQGHMQAANCIVRFAQAGHVWLVQNTLRHSPYDKNSLLISDGPGIHPQAPLAEHVVSADFPAAALTVTRLADCGQAEWTRHIFWSRGGDGWFVVIDRATFKADGEHSVTCTWRTPAFAQLDGRRWRSAQGSHRFEIVAGDNVSATSEEETNQGASRPYVLRERRTGTHRRDDEATFQNLFYVRAQSDRESLDLRRMDARRAVVLQDGRPLAWCAAAPTPELAWLPGATVAAESLLLTAAVLVAAGVTQLTLPGLSLRSRSGVSLSLDFDGGGLTIRGSGTVTVGGKPQAATDGEKLTLPPELGAALRSWLDSLRPMPAAPALVAAAGSDSHWRSLWSRPTGPGLPERLRNLCVTATPPPADGMTLQLIDTVPPQSREIAELWPAAPHYDITLEFPAPTAVESISLLGDCVDEPTLRTFSPLPDGSTLEAETPDGQRHACALEPAPDRMFKRVYVDLAVSLQQRRAVVDRTVHSLHVRCPAPANGLPFVLHEIEIFGPRRPAPAVKHWIATDLDGDGANEIVVCDSTATVRVLDAAGRTRWEQSLPQEVTHLSVHPAGESGVPAICAGLIDGSLHVFDADGHTLWQRPLSADLRGFNDRLMGIFYVVNSLAVWRRDETGRGWLVVGGYGLLLFLDGSGRILGHDWADGAWVSSLLALPSGDIFARSGWNHGINCYAGLPGAGASGGIQTWGGFRQPMFRELKQVTPFVNGPSLAFELVALPGLPASAIFAAAELGFGLFSTETRDFVWKHEIAGRLQCACLGEVPGRPAAILGGADGSVNAFDLSDGGVLRTHFAGAPVVGVSQSSNGNFVVATRAGLHVLDAAWQPRTTLALPLRRALALDDARILISRDDHTLELLEFQN